MRRWDAVLHHAQQRTALVRELAGMLTPAVLRPLPPPLQLDFATPDIAGWVAELAAQGDVSTIRGRSDGALIGLLIAAAEPGSETSREPGGGPIHIGYLLAEPAWGRGLATELLRGMVAAHGDQTFLAGVARDNPASVRVLEKAGFKPDQANAGGSESLFFRLDRD